jgi:hypothetical protein
MGCNGREVGSKVVGTRRSRVASEGAWTLVRGSQSVLLDVVGVREVVLLPWDLGGPRRRRDGGRKCRRGSDGGNGGLRVRYDWSGGRGARGNRGGGSLRRRRSSVGIRLAVREVESLTLLLRPYSTIPDVEDETAKCCVGQVPGEHNVGEMMRGGREETYQFQQFFHAASSNACPLVAFAAAGTRLATASALVNSALWFSLNSRSTRQSSLSNTGDKGEYVLDDTFHLSLDSVPHLVEALLGVLQLSSKRLGIVLDAELVVRDSVSEVKAGREGEVGLEDEGELGEESFATGGGVGDEKAGFGLVVDLRGELVNLGTSHEWNGCTPSEPCRQSRQSGAWSSTSYRHLLQSSLSPFRCRRVCDSRPLLRVQRVAASHLQS